MRISDWSSDVCSSDLTGSLGRGRSPGERHAEAIPAADGARRGLARSDPPERTGADTVAVGKQRMAGDDALQDREAPLDDDAPALQQRAGRQLVGRRGLALADAPQRPLPRPDASAAERRV